MSLVAGPGRGSANLDAQGQKLQVDKHVRYIQELSSRDDEIAYWLTEHLRISGVYWGLTALHILQRPDALPRDELLDFVFSCMHDNGAFGAGPGHDFHLTFTLNAVQILALLDGFDEYEKRLPGAKAKTGQFIASLQRPEHALFAGDEWGETDTRFLYSALNALSLLDALHLVDMDIAVNHVLACQNVDGAFGASPGAESHAAQVFTCVGALAIAGRLDAIDADKLGGWLSERQLPNGGFNGRPEKLEDVCYSWWVMSSLAMIDRLHWIDHAAITKFVLSCQDDELGGISDRPGDMVDVFHTHFALAGLSLLGYDGLASIDPVYCLPKSVITRVIGNGRS